MDTKPIRIYTEHYELLMEIKQQLRQKWHREATFADAVRYIVSHSNLESEITVEE